MLSVENALLWHRLKDLDEMEPPKFLNTERRIRSTKIL